MEARELDLAVVPAQSCFVGLPRALVHRWGDTSSLVLHLRWQGGEAHVGWGGSASTSAGALEVPAALAEALGMRPPMRLRVCPVQVPVASAVSVQPESAADWEAVQQAALFSPPKASIADAPWGQLPRDGSGSPPPP